MVLNFVSSTKSCTRRTCFLNTHSNIAGVVDLQRFKWKLSLELKEKPNSYQENFPKWKKNGSHFPNFNRHLPKSTSKSISEIFSNNLETWQLCFRDNEIIDSLIRFWFQVSELNFILDFRNFRFSKFYFYFRKSLNKKLLWEISSFSFPWNITA